MLNIKHASTMEYEEILSFFYGIIDTLPPYLNWKKGIYPSDEFIRQTIEKNEMIIARVDGKIVAAMVLNNIDEATSPYGQNKIFKILSEKTTVLKLGEFQIIII